MKKSIASIAGFLLAASLLGCAQSDIDVPDVVGQKADDAKDVLMDSGFYNVDMVEEDGDAAYVAAAYTVVGQSPQAGDKCTASDTVTLTVRNDAEAKAAEKRQADAAAEAMLDEMEGSPAAEAYDALTSDGYSVEVLHAVSKQDYSSEINTGETEWLVSGYDGLNADKKRVTILVDTRDGIDQRAANAAVREVLDGKLPVSNAWTAVKSYGKQQYPYGFKLHDIMGVLAETAQDENTWFLKATCDVTNEYGAKAKDLVCEAEVAGTKDSPEVISFTVY